MKPSFHARLINGPFEDPGLYVRVLRQGRALMFDLGSTGSLSARDILKTSHFFITHTHIDHFIGFDNVLRTCLKRDSVLHFFGPEGFIDCIKGKLKSYTWNLIRDYPLVIEASEVSPNAVKKVVFKASNSFECEEIGIEPFNGILFIDALFKVSAAVLDHIIPCLGFCLEEDFHINIDKEKLEKMSLPIGPWLNDLKAAIRGNRPDSTFFVNEKQYSFSELRHVAAITRGQKLSYIVDVIGNKDNTSKIVELVKGSDILYIEAYFMDDEKARARERYHLTAKEAGSIAREAKAGRVEPIHFSPRYMDNPESLLEEVQKAYSQ